MTNATTPSPMMVMQMMQGHQAAGILTAAIQLGVFAAVDGGAKTASAIAGKIACPASSTGTLVNALVALGLLAKSGEDYTLTAPASAYLVPGKPMYMGDVAGIMGSRMIFEGMGRLAEAVRAGGTVLDTHAETPEHPFWETFAKSSAALAMPVAARLNEVLRPFIESKPRLKVLDIAAGSGIYGYTLAKHPNVDVTFVDWPNVLVHTKEWGGRLGADMSRAHFIEGNLFEAPFGGPYDVVLACNIYHHFDAETCQRLAKKIAAATAPGGRAVTVEFITDEQVSNPAAAFFAITMLAWSRKGTAYSEKDYTGWFTAAGLGTPAVHRVDVSPESILVCEKS